jgi:hypothetical protein
VVKGLVIGCPDRAWPNFCTIFEVSDSPRQPADRKAGALV